MPALMRWEGLMCCSKSACAMQAISGRWHACERAGSCACSCQLVYVTARWTMKALNSCACVCTHTLHTSSVSCDLAISGRIRSVRGERRPASVHGLTCCCAPPTHTELLRPRRARAAAKSAATPPMRGHRDPALSQLPRLSLGAAGSARPAPPTPLPIPTSARTSKLGARQPVTGP